MDDREKIENAGEDLMDKLIGIKELNTISEFMDDPDLDKALVFCVKVIANPNISPKTASTNILHMSALCMEFRLKAKNYMLLEKDAKNASQKKNIYLTVADALQELVNSLKYITKV